MVQPEIIVAILSGYRLSVKGIHGVSHWGRVFETGLRLAARTGADPDVVALFSVLHDARRWNDGRDPEHGRRGAALASRLRPLMQVTDEQFAHLLHACMYHSDGATKGDVTVQACWDADRLDLWRVGISPRDSWLCTHAARDAELQAWTRLRSVEDHLPDCAVEWLRTAKRSQ